MTHAIPLLIFGIVWITIGLGALIYQIRRPLWKRMGYESQEMFEESERAMAETEKFLQDVWRGGQP